MGEWGTTLGDLIRTTVGIQALIHTKHQIRSFQVLGAYWIMRLGHIQGNPGWGLRRRLCVQERLFQGLGL